mgnify:CR=1 FL=1
MNGKKFSKVSIGLATLFFTAAAIVTLAAKTGYCAWCPSYTCYARCSSQCACVTVGSGGGQCVSIQMIPDGATVLE